MINFISPQKKTFFANIWRNIIAGTILVAIFAGAGFYLIRDTYVDQVAEGMLEPVQVVLQEKIYSYDEIGGDVAFDYEPVIIPKLSSSSIALDSSLFTATNIIAKDRDSNVILYEKEPYVQHGMASITKLMSALVLLEHDMDWATSTQVIADDVVDTHMYAGDTYTIDELWHAALVASSNKAVLTLVDASGVSRENFIARMNARAVELGMSETVFTDPTGLDDENMSTPSDIILLLREALNNDTIVEGLLTPEYTLYSYEREKKHHMWNTNWVLLEWIPHEFELLGGKTGFIPSSGYNFTMAVSQDDRIVDIVVLGTESNEARFVEARDVAKWIYNNYIWE